jgi:hypothetical protein
LYTYIYQSAPPALILYALFFFISSYFFFYSLGAGALSAAGGVAKVVPIWEYETAVLNPR